jgi:two-component system chemotaxis response regulator CheY
MDEDGQDSFKEFLNCVGGLLVADLSNKDIKELEIEPPEYAADFALGQEVVVFPFSLPMGDFFLTVLEPGKTAAPAGKRFVLVDDSKIARHLLKTILEEAGHEVVGEATNGLDGYDMYRHHKPDFITLDVTMPILNGIECLKKIMHSGEGANAIMVTSVGKEKLIAEAKSIGAKAVLVKPIEKKDVLNVINSLM